MSLNGRDLVSRIFCMIKDKNGRAPAQPWSEGIISTAAGLFLEHPQVHYDICALGSARRVGRVNEEATKEKIRHV